MAGTGFAQILCTKCGSASAEPRLECAKCGGRNARVCGKCGNQNSVAKNFCDKCGTSISQLGPAAPPPQTAPPGPGASDIPKTAIQRAPSPAAAPAKPAPKLPPPGAPAQPGPAGAAAGKPIPAAGENKGIESTKLDDLWSAPAQPREDWNPSKPPPPSLAKRVFGVLAALAAAAAALYGVWFWKESRKPEVLVPKLAAQYLEALRLHDYSAAYAMFSALSKKNCTEDEFRASRDDTEWSWSGLKIEYQEPGAVLLEYRLTTKGFEPRTDHLLFTLEATPEGNKWTRPYNWTLMRQVEESFDKGDADKGLILAQAAAEVNPRDPLAWGYLCEAAYYRKAPEIAEARCARAIELAKIYPSNLTLKSLYHLHAILADTYDHALRRPDKALDQYAAMLAFPDISPADQCQILLARAQTYTSISRPGEALQDLQRGRQMCENPQDQAYIQKMLQALSAPPQ